MRQTWAVVIGAGVFAVSFLALGLSLLPCAGIAAAGYGAGLLLFYKKNRQVEVEPGAAVDADSLKKLLAEADSKISSIAVFRKKIVQPEMQRHLDKICRQAQGIVDDIRKDPKDARRARQFLNYYLDAVARIVGYYSELTERGIQSEDARSALSKVENMFGTVETAFEKQRAALAQDDVLDLDAEIDLLKKTLAMEGMTNEK